MWSTLTQSVRRPGSTPGQERFYPTDTALTICQTQSNFRHHDIIWNFKIFSGIYYQKIPLAQIDSVLFVDKLPEMERSSGFSWNAKEKGVFKDSITQSKVYVFVDDLRQQKIKVVHHDSLKMYVNLQDSLQTQELLSILQTELQNRITVEWDQCTVKGCWL